MMGDKFLNKLKIKRDNLFYFYSWFIFLLLVPFIYHLKPSTISFDFKFVLFLFLLTVTRFFSFSLFTTTTFKFDTPISFAAVFLFNFSELIILSVVSYWIYLFYSKKHIFLNRINVFRAVTFGIFNMSNSLLSRLGAHFFFIFAFDKLPLVSFKISYIWQFILSLIIFELISFVFIVGAKLSAGNQIKTYVKKEKWIYTGVDLYLYPLALMIIITYVYADILGLIILTSLLIQVILILKDLLKTKFSLDKKIKQLNLENKIIKLAESQKIDYEAFYHYIQEFSTIVWERSNILLDIHKKEGITEVPEDLADFYISRRVFPIDFHLFIYSYFLENPKDFVNLQNRKEISEFFEGYFSTFLSNFKNILIIPIFHFEKLFGVFMVFEYASYIIGEEEIESYINTLKQISLILNNLYVYQTLEDRIYERTAEIVEKNVQLLETNEKLREVSRSKERFFAKVSHDLKTPLNAILGFSEMLLNGITGDINDNQRDAVERIKSAGDSLLKLVKDILEISKFNNYEIKLDKSIFSFNEFCMKIYKEIYPLFIKKDLKFILDIPEEEIFVEGDPDRLKNAVTNLLDNAIKYSSYGGKVILGLRKGMNLNTENVTAICKADENISKKALVFVKDSGSGILKSQHKEIFEEFVQLSDKSFSSGIGLGLSIVKKTIELHDENFYIDSEPGAGTTFYFTLKIRRSS